MCRAGSHDNRGNLGVGSINHSINRPSNQTVPRGGSGALWVICRCPSCHLCDTITKGNHRPGSLITNYNSELPTIQLPLLTRAFNEVHNTWNDSHGDTRMCLFAKHTHTNAHNYTYTHAHAINCMLNLCVCT